MSAWLTTRRARAAVAVYDDLETGLKTAHREAGRLRAEVDRLEGETPGAFLEEDGLMHLFIGAMGSYKNPHSHRAVPMENAGEAIEIVTLASHLLRLVDEAQRPAQQERQV